MVSIAAPEGLLYTAVQDTTSERQARLRFIARDMVSRGMTSATCVYPKAPRA